MAQEQSTEERIKALRQQKREITEELRYLAPPKQKRPKRRKDTEDWVTTQEVSDLVAKTPF